MHALYVYCHVQYIYSVILFTHQKSSLYRKKNTQHPFYAFSLVDDVVDDDDGVVDTCEFWMRCAYTHLCMFDIAFSILCVYSRPSSYGLASSSCSRCHFKCNFHIELNNEAILFSIEYFTHKFSITMRQFLVAKISDCVRYIVSMRASVCALWNILRSLLSLFIPQRMHI